MARQQALVIDDEPDIRELLVLTLTRMGLAVDTAGTVKDALERLAQHRYDLCFTDMRLPDGSGQEIIESVAKNYPSMPIAMITAHGNMDAAVTALKAGAFDFVTKPVDLSVLRRMVNSALKLGEPKKADSSRSSAPVSVGTGPVASRLIGQSTAMQQLKATVAKVARSQAPVHIFGESGTGKELVARLIHEQGPRAGGPFLAVNCGAIPTELMESEFFGHKKGSFTGAVSDKDGMFVAASGGTLFLDEVADLPVHMQVKLLRVIQEKAVRPVGSTTEIPIDVRILSATHKHLDHLVTEGRFRQDLYYRINVIELRVPALRERGEDIPLLAQAYLARMAADWHLERIELDSSALDELNRYDFPGNVRELENILERAVALCDEHTIRAADLGIGANRSEVAPPKLIEPVEDEGDPDNDPADLEGYVANIERKAILEALAATQNNKTRAAERLGISFRALRYKLKKLGV